MAGRWIAGSAVLGTAIILALVLLLSSMSAAARADALSPAHTGSALAALGIRATEVEAREVPTSTWRRGIDGEALLDGMGVRTGATGVAQVTYVDGSLARLAPDTTFEVVRLDGEAVAPDIAVRLDVGRVWNRVQHVTGARGSYEVETAVGTAAVRGTVFLVECDLQPQCTFTVLDGIVEVTTIDGRVFVIESGEELTLGIVPVDPDPPAPAAEPTEPVEPSPSDPTPSGTVTPTTSPTDAASPSPTPSPSPSPTPTPTPTPSPTPVRPPAEPTLEVIASEAPGRGTFAARPYIAVNLAADAAAGADRVGDEDCQVSIAGRNAALAATPRTAIDVPHDGAIDLVAVATGDLAAYRVDVTLAGLTFLAGEGPVEPDDNGDRSTFRARVDVADHARWGAGLYEVDAATFGTNCRVATYVNVTGGTPLTTLPGIGAMLLLLVGLVGLAAGLSGLTSHAATMGTSPQREARP